MNIRKDGFLILSLWYNFGQHRNISTIFYARTRYIIIKCWTLIEIDIEQFFIIISTLSAAYININIVISKWHVSVSSFMKVFLYHSDKKLWTCFNNIVV